MEREQVDEEMVRQRLGVAVERVERVRRERGRDDPPVVRLVDVFVQPGVVFEPMDKVLPRVEVSSRSAFVEGRTDDEQVGEPEEEERAQDKVAPSTADVPVRSDGLFDDRRGQDGRRELGELCEREALDVADRAVHCATVTQ